jgi:transcriptional regulator with XRE-family HTH domain
VELELGNLTADMAHQAPRPLDQLARDRIKVWIGTHGTTQAKLGDLIGRNQAWMSRYLSGGMDADLETLQKIAKAFNHSLSALLDTPTDPDEIRIIEAYRAVPVEDRALALRVLQKFARPNRAPRKR